MNAWAVCRCAMRLVRVSLSAVACAVIASALLYELLGSPLLHIVYEPLPPAGDSSIYVPGSGFAGFWYHLGFFQENDHLLRTQDKSFYCYSSGCLSLVFAFLNASLHSTFDTCQDIQNRLFNGTLRRSDLVEELLHRVMPNASMITRPFNATSPRHLLTNDDVGDLHEFLSRVHILVTSASDGVQAVKANSHPSLVDLLIKTTYIPFVTGDSVALQQPDTRRGVEYYLDGGFSRALHPECQHQVPRVPLSVSSFVYTLHPGMDKRTAYGLWEMGRNAPSQLSSERTGSQAFNDVGARFLRYYMSI